METAAVFQTEMSDSEWRLRGSLPDITIKPFNKKGFIVDIIYICDII